MAETIHLDANVVLRFLLADHPKLSKRARILFEKSEHGSPYKLYISHVCLAEIAWVLTSFYKLDRKIVSPKLMALILHAGVTVDDLDVIIATLDNFAELKVDYIDCYNAALANRRGAKLASFDKDFKKFDEIELLDF